MGTFRPAPLSKSDHYVLYYDVRLDLSHKSDIETIKHYITAKVILKNVKKIYKSIDWNVLDDIRVN